MEILRKVTPIQRQIPDLWERPTEVINVPRPGRLPTAIEMHE